MTKTTTFAALVAAFLLVAPEAYADGTTGEVTKVDTRRNRVTVKHGPIENLNMQAMTMVFEVSDPAMMEKLKVGTPIVFTADRINGKLTITELE